jgi:hypothetical protein
VRDIIVKAPALYNNLCSSLLLLDLLVEDLEFRSLVNVILLKPCLFILEIILFKSALNKHYGTKEVYYFNLKTNQLE